MQIFVQHSLHPQAAQLVSSDNAQQRTETDQLLARWVQVNSGVWVQVGTGELRCVGQVGTGELRCVGTGGYR